MAKTARSKKQSTSKHSRAARRAASPSLDVDKSLLSLTRPESPPCNNTSGQPYHLLAAQGPNGISKKRNKKESRNQRLRREKGLARAEINLDVLEVKRERSEGKGRVIDQRRKAWEDVGAQRKPGKPKKLGFDALADQMDEDRMGESEAQRAPEDATPTNPSNQTRKPIQQPVADTEVDEIT